LGCHGPKLGAGDQRHTAAKLHESIRKKPTGGKIFSKTRCRGDDGTAWVFRNCLQQLVERSRASFDWALRTVKEYHEKIEYVRIRTGVPGNWYPTATRLDTELKLRAGEYNFNTGDGSMPSGRDQVFISYSHEDREWLARVQAMLKPLVRNSTISVWDDTKIKAGARWKEEIEPALGAAKVAVLLVSPNFLKSDFIAKHELPPILNAAAKDGLLIFWLLVSDCLYEETEIKDYQAAHDISKPLDSLTPAERNAVLADVCRRIKTVNAAPESAPTVGQKPEHSSTRASESLVKLTVRRTYSNDKLQSAQPWREIGDCRFQRDFEVAADPVFDLMVENTSGRSLLFLKTGIRILQRKPETGGVMGGPAQFIKVQAQYSVHCHEDWKRFNLNDNEVWASFQYPVWMKKDDDPFMFTLCLENFCDTDSASSSEIRFCLQTTSGTVESESIWLEQ
jgi:hypothetical protein